MYADFPARFCLDPRVKGFFVIRLFRLTSTDATPAVVVQTFVDNPASDEEFLIELMINLV